MRLPIDTTAIKFVADGAAEPVLDFATKAPRTDEHGTVIYGVPEFSAGSGVKDSISVKVAGEVAVLGRMTLAEVRTSACVCPFGCQSRF